MSDLERTCWKIIQDDRLPASAPVKLEAWENLRWSENEKAQRKAQEIHQQVEKAASMSWWQKILA